MKKNEKVDICVGMPDDFRRDAAESYIKAFPYKFGTILGDGPRSVKVLERDLDGDLAVAAAHNGKFAGVAGLSFGGKRFLNHRKRTFVRNFGLVKGLLRFSAVKAFSRSAGKKEMLFDGLVVPESMRGKGIGAKILESVCDYARDRGFESLRLVVLDTNPRARSLYERSGFRPVKTRRYPFLSSLGFSGVTTMVKAVA